MSHPALIFPCHRTIEQERSRWPVLRWTPTAWAQLLFLRDYGPMPLIGCGLTPGDDPLLVEGIRLMPQCRLLQDIDVASVTAGRGGSSRSGERHCPAPPGRIWIQCRPGDAPRPSTPERDAFSRNSAAQDWSVLFCLGQSGACWGELYWRLADEYRLPLRVAVDFAGPFPASDPALWEAEFGCHLHNGGFSDVNGAEPPF